MMERPDFSHRIALQLLSWGLAHFLGALPVSAQPVTLTAVEAYPNGRTSNDLPSNAIDGNINTFTWTTEAYNTNSPSYLAVGFASTSVNRIRLWKTPDGGGGQNSKDLVIDYTTDPSGPLSARQWKRVTGLKNGFAGQELMKIGFVEPVGWITNDQHNSPAGDGWASLSFDPVTASGIRVGFRSPGLVHYRVGELQVLLSRTQAQTLSYYYPQVNGAVLTAAWIPDETARRFCSREAGGASLVDYSISCGAIPAGAAVTRANLFSSDDWGKTFNGSLNPDQDKPYARIRCKKEMPVQ